MDLLKLVLTVLLLLTNVYCWETDPERWREIIEQNKRLNAEEIQDLFVRVARKPGPRQQVGLTGRKESAQAARKRHKFQTFVGLMGRRSFEDEGERCTD